MRFDNLTKALYLSSVKLSEFEEVISVINQIVRFDYRDINNERKNGLNKMGLGRIVFYFIIFT